MPPILRLTSPARLVDDEGLLEFDLAQAGTYRVWSLAQRDHGPSPSHSGLLHS
jgi:hypothetical protein